MRLRDVLPGVAAGDFADRRLTDPEANGNGPLRARTQQPSDLHDLTLGQLMPMAMPVGMVANPVSAPSRETPLGRRISRIHSGGAEEQVIRSDAGRVVAAVEDPQPVWNGTVGQLPRNAMGECVGVPPAASDLTIAAGPPGRALPFPTAVGFRDSWPEAVTEWGPSYGHGAIFA